ncbi:MAG: class I SAM-dependent methyltransferase [Acidobacteriota bacterium]|nr:class I SAM-dependent methyltransferase [Acidobacteriota bacterium]
MTSNNDSVRFWNRKAASYAEQPIRDTEAYEKKLAITREYLNPQSSVLEFGCGTGSTALLHAPHVKQILALDSSEKMIEIAGAKAEKEGVSNVDFMTATLTDLQRPPASFDVILGLNVLHLLDDREEAIRRCFELLAPGGIFISSTACIARLGFLIKMLLPIGARLKLIPKVQIFTRETLEADIERAGFQILRSTVFNKNGMITFIVARK